MKLTENTKDKIDSYFNSNEFEDYINKNAKEFDEPTLEIINSKVIEIHRNYVTLNCIVTPNEYFETRVFDLDIFVDMNIKVNDFIQINIEKGCGYVQFNFKKLNKDLSNQFIKKNIFEDLPDSFFQPLPSDEGIDYNF